MLNTFVETIVAMVGVLLLPPISGLMVQTKKNFHRIHRDSRCHIREMKM